MRNSIRYSLRATIFGIGLTLSPLTLWNDAFINFPLSVLISEPLVFLFGFDRALTYVAAYAFTNVLGIALMAVTSATSVFDIFRASTSGRWFGGS